MPRADLRASTGPLRFGSIRDLEVINSELWLLTRRSPGVPRAVLPLTGRFTRLLDKRNTAT
jgi:hypothetical protein